MTAVEWLREQYDNCPRYEENLTDGDFSKALEMEKYKAERMYSEEEVFKLICNFNYDLQIDECKDIKEWFEQFKNK